MKRPSKKEIRAEIERLKAKPAGTFKPIEQKGGGKLASKKSSQRIRKQGV